MKLVARQPTETMVPTIARGTNTVAGAYPTNGSAFRPPNCYIQKVLQPDNSTVHLKQPGASSTKVCFTDRQKEIP